MAKIAVVLFNLGGPDRLDAVQPFLFNLFNDAAIIRVPKPFRWLLAHLISRRRAGTAKEIYRQIGGRSPLLEQTKEQARAVEDLLNASVERHDAGPGDRFRVFVAMRYWHPFALETAQAVKGFDADEIILLPLYPQYSTTTTGSSFDDWDKAAAFAGLQAKTRRLCCYPSSAGFVNAHVDEILAMADRVDAAKNAAAENSTESAVDAPWRILFSAHGLPKKIVAGGDPYQHQIELTANLILQQMQSRGVDEPLDWVVCYQSRVGPLEWIGPSTDEEIQRAGRDGVGVILVPIAFVSEHSETLVELDIEYKELADAARVPAYHRVPAIGANHSYIECLAHLVAYLRQSSEAGPVSAAGSRICPDDLSQCPCRI